MSWAIRPALVKHLRVCASAKEAAGEILLGAAQTVVSESKEYDKCDFGRWWKMMAQLMIMWAWNMIGSKSIPMSRLEGKRISQVESIKSMRRSSALTVSMVAGGTSGEGSKERACLRIMARRRTASRRYAWEEQRVRSASRER